MEDLAHKHIRKAKLLVELIIRRNEAASVFKKRARSAEGMNGKLMSICFKSLSPSIALYLKQIMEKNVSEQLIPEHDPLADFRHPHTSTFIISPPPRERKKFGFTYTRRNLNLIESFGTGMASTLIP